VAAELEKDPDVTVERVRGGIGELRVESDGKELYDTNRLWYPRVSRVAAAVRANLNGKGLGGAKEEGGRGSRRE